MSTYEPIADSDEDDSAQDGASVVHVDSGNGLHGRERQENDEENAKEETDNVDGDGPLAQAEGSVYRWVALELADENEEERNAV